MLEYDATSTNKRTIIDSAMRQSASPIPPICLASDLHIPIDAAPAHKAGAIANDSIMACTGTNIEKYVLTDDSMVVDRNPRT